MNRGIIFSKKYNTGFTLTILIIIACLIPFILGKIVGERKDFYNELWGPAYLLVHGKSPYDTSSLNTELPAVWLPMGIGLFAPLGWLDEHTATLIWFLFNVTEVAVIVFLALGDSKSPIVAGVAVLFVYFFPGSISHFVLGQFSITITLCMILAVYFAKRKQDWSAAFFLALGCTKPQLGILAMIGLTCFYLDSSGLRGTIQFGIKTLVMALAMSLPLFIAYPAWIKDWFASSQRNPAWAHPSILSLLLDTVGNWGYFIWGCIALAGIFACFYFWKEFAPDVAMLWTLGLTTIVSPYIWSWDFVLLLPILVSSFARGNWKNKILFIVAYLLGWIGMAIVQVKANGNNQAFWWVPLWFMGIVLVNEILKSKPEAQTTS